MGVSCDADLMGPAVVRAELCSLCCERMHKWDVFIEHRFKGHSGDYKGIATICGSCAEEIAGTDFQLDLIQTVATNKMNELEGHHRFRLIRYTEERLIQEREDREKREKQAWAELKTHSGKDSEPATEST